MAYIMTKAQKIQRVRRVLVNLLLTLAIMVAITKAIPFWLFLALVILGCLAFYPGGMIDNFLTRISKP